MAWGFLQWVCNLMLYNLFYVRYAGVIKKGTLAMSTTNSNSNFTGFLCEYGDAQLIICGVDANAELRTMDEDGEVQETYRCALHTPAIEQLDAQGCELYLLPSGQFAGVA